MLQRLRPYPAYKDSGAPWLGGVPEHWRILPNRALFLEVNERGCPDEPMLSVTITRGVVKQSELLKDSSKKDSSREDRSAYKLVIPGDIAYNKMRAWQGAIGASDFRGIVSPAYVVQRLRGDDVPRYYHYLFRSPAFAKEAERWSYGITSDMWSLRPEHFRLICSCNPPMNEQHGIVRFLDYMDRRIRHYIRAKQKLIKLLEEQKQAVVAHVFKCLENDYDKVALRYVGTKFGSGVTPRGGATVYEETGIPFLRSQNVHFDGLHLEDVACISAHLHASLANTHVRPGDVLLNITGASIGRVCYVPDEFGEANVNQHVCIIRPNRRRVLPGFLAAYLSTPSIQHEIRLEQSGASREGLTLHSIRSFKVPLPPTPEQMEVLRLIAAQTGKLAGGIAGARAGIDFVREYHTRLVCDVVTGKLDVREAAANLPDEAEEPELLEDETLISEEDRAEEIAEEEAALEEVEV